MAGALERDKRQRAHVWWGAMMPHLAKPPTFEKFTGYQPDRAELVRRWQESWDRVDAALGGKGN